MLSPPACSCPVGIATQDPELRKKFKGTPEHIITFLLHTAEQVRRILAGLGVRRLEDIIGRSDLLRLREGAVFPKGPADLSALLADPDPTHALPRRCADQSVRSDPDASRGFSVLGADTDDVVWQTCEGFVDAIAARVHRGELLPPVRGGGASSDAASRYGGDDAADPEAHGEAGAAVVPLLSSLLSTDA